MTLHLCLPKWRHPISPEFGVTDNVELTLGRHVVLTWWNAITLVCGKLLETISQSIGNCCKTRAQLQFKGNGADKSILMDKLSRCQINMSLLHYLFLSTGLNSGGSAHNIQSAIVHLEMRKQLFYMSCFRTLAKPDAAV